MVISKYFFARLGIVDAIDLFGEQPIGSIPFSHGAACPLLRW